MAIANVKSPPATGQRNRAELEALVRHRVMYLTIGIFVFTVLMACAAALWLKPDAEWVLSQTTPEDRKLARELEEAPFEHLRQILQILLPAETALLGTATGFTRELEALRDRVRNFSVASPHWPTDGEWKESVLRAMLKGYLPAHIEPLRGFVVAPTRGTRQIDLLLYDNRKPVLFRNGDLVFVTPDAVVGIVEVKSSTHDRGALRKALGLLADNAEMIRGERGVGQDLFVGLFSYQTDLGAARFQEVLQDLQSTARGVPERVVSFVCLGCSHFEMFWHTDPSAVAAIAYDTWHAYRLPDQAAGYFINNLVAAVSGDSVERNLEAWFPSPSKELDKLGSEPFRKA